MQGTKTAPGGPTRIIAAVLATVVLAACGEDTADSQPTTEPPAASPPAATPTATATATPTPSGTASPTETPTASSQTYEVQQGDTLSAIAAELGTTVQALVEANDIEDPDEIFPGDVLTIPGG